jgi:hypothetical protein
MSSTSLASACAPVSAHIILPISPSLQHTTRCFLMCFSLWSLDKCSSTTQCKVDQLCVLLAKTLSPCILLHVCFSRTSSLLCLLQPNIPLRVCPSLSSVSTSAKSSFMCLPQQNIIQMTFQRSLKIPLQSGTGVNSETLANKTRQDCRRWWWEPKSHGTYTLAPISMQDTSESCTRWGQHWHPAPRRNLQICEHIRASTCEAQPGTGEWYSMIQKPPHDRGCWTLDTATVRPTQVSLSIWPIWIQYPRPNWPWSLLWFLLFCSSFLHIFSLIFFFHFSLKKEKKHSLTRFSGSLCFSLSKMFHIIW